MFKYSARTIHFGYTKKTFTFVKKYVAQWSLVLRCCHSRYSSTFACCFELDGYQWSFTLNSRHTYLVIPTLKRSKAVKTIKYKYCIYILWKDWYLSQSMKPSCSITGTFLNGLICSYSGVYCSRFFRFTIFFSNGMLHVLKNIYNALEGCESRS